MGVRFRETMRGTVHRPEGPVRFSFSVEAASPSVWAIGGWRAMELRGTADLDGVCTGARLLPGSTLWVGVPFHGQLRYYVAFVGPDGAVWRLYGQKRPKLSRFVSTMTHLEGGLFRNGVEFGRAELRFPLEDLPDFLKSFRFGG